MGGVTENHVSHSRREESRALILQIVAMFPNATRAKILRETLLSDRTLKLHLPVLIAEGALIEDRHSVGGHKNIPFTYTIGVLEPV
jgi:hypothetical protein